MRKIFLVLLLITVLSLSLSSCISHQPFPYGKWENKTIGLTLDMKPDNSFHGKYNNHGENINIIILSPIGIDALYINNMDDINDGSSYGSPLFSGMFQVKDNKLYYTLDANWQEAYGIKDTIIFEKIEEYGESVTSGSFSY